jgi:hypothetical protein
MAGPPSPHARQELGLQLAAQLGLPPRLQVLDHLRLQPHLLADGVRENHDENTPRDQNRHDNRQNDLLHVPTLLVDVAHERCTWEEERAPDGHVPQLQALRLQEVFYTVQGHLPPDVRRGPRAGVRKGVHKLGRVADDGAGRLVRPQQSARFGGVPDLVVIRVGVAEQVGAVGEVEHPPLEVEFADDATYGGQIIRDAGYPDREHGARLYDPLCQDDGRDSHRGVDSDLHPQPVGRVECLGVPEPGPEVDGAPGGGALGDLWREAGGSVQHLGRRENGNVICNFSNGVVRRNGAT